MSSNAENRTLSFDKKALRNEYADISHLRGKRDMFARRFANHINLLLESKKPRKVFSNKGLLDPRRVYRHSFDDNIFSRTTKVNSSDTTIVFLLDGSGSMSGKVFDDMSRIEVCTVISSAFAKAVKMTVNSEIKVEVFLKSASGHTHKGTTGTDNGAFINLTRIFTNDKNATDFDSILETDTHMPYYLNGKPSGSYTAELAVLPAFLHWAKKNIKTKNMVLLNITDGEAYAVLNDYTIGDAENRTLRMKYLRNLNHLNMMIGGRYSEAGLRNIYGDSIMCVNDSSFHAELFKKLSSILETAL
tara:strand:- start:124 stop:1029 length:906 start_codon:yes stop_codon:yes gene_type:complete